MKLPRGVKIPGVNAPAKLPHRQTRHLTAKEKDVQKQIVHWLRLHHFTIWRQNSGAVLGTYNGKKRFVKFHDQPGLSDIIGILPDGRFLAIEVKRPGGHLTQDQNVFIQLVNSLNGLAFVAQDLNDVIEHLESEGYIEPVTKP